MLRVTRPPQVAHQNQKRAGAGTEPSTARVEAFSDGVFAIAITLLILELKVPQLHATSGTLARALGALWPSYLAYAFSFLIIGIYWANHHAIFRLYRRTDHTFVLLNIAFLGCISFLPFPTSVLADYVADAAHRQTAIVYYAFSLFLPSLAWLSMWLYASRGHHLLDADLDARFVATQTRRFAFTNAVYLAAIALALWNDVAGLLVCVGVTLAYLSPPARPIYG